MASSTIAETRDGLSAIVNGIISGAETEHVICRRNTPVARIVPYLESPAPQDSDRMHPQGAQVVNSDDWSAENMRSATAAVPLARGLRRMQAGAQDVSAFGMFSHRAAPAKRAREKNAWQQAAAEKHAGS